MLAFAMLASATLVFLFAPGAARGYLATFGREP